MKKIWFYNYKVCSFSKLLNLGIAEENGAICRVLFGEKYKLDGFEKQETPLIKETAKQLDEYFLKKRKVFDLPLILKGTDFQNKVWDALQNIPYGKTCSYGELAAITGNSKASRAVGMANNRNPIVIIIPCHRVIGHDGSLTGYAGGLELKRQLLELEK
ncbi:MAG: methylated-DNA--[protein]-cysteine S-methyltransferase [Spirochaetes bacterium]|nr:methylated-DNA--[protein]-cysteine S-methyltransferase [Spirochaetota bacterium]